MPIAKPNEDRYTTTTNEPVSAASMNLFGLPYQFPPAVDPRVGYINEKVGRRYTENILLEGPVLTIIPGKAKFMPGQKEGKKQTVARMLLDDNESFTDYVNAFKDATGSKNTKIYDFDKDYIRYMRCVNLLCVAGAVMLGLKDTEVELCGETVKLGDYDWKDYKWLKKSKRYTSTTRSINEIIKSYQFLQFYVDADSLSYSEGMSNATEQSKLKSLFDTTSSAVREFRFIANSHGGGRALEGLTDLAQAAGASMDDMISEVLAGTKAENGIVGDIGQTVGRILNMGSNVLKGDNIIIPDIYSSSSYSKNYDINLKLKTPYGTKLGYYLNIFVPLAHLVALGMPILSTANTYESPFLIKAYIEGSWSCNLGIVSSISISKSAESRSIEGLPNEIEVNLSIQDLYTDLALTDQDPFDISAKTLQFAGNSSLVEFLATNCGLSLSQPNFDIKMETLLTEAAAFFTNGPGNVAASIQHSVFNLINSVTQLT